MAFEHALIVRDSDLYEYKGFAKVILTLIAQLIISEPKENDQGKPIGERDPDAGWCMAGEDYLAAALGISADCVSRNIGLFRKDGWIEVVTWRTRLGHLRNKYRIPDDKLKEIKARAYKKDEAGNIVRGAQTNKARKMGRGDKGRFLTAKSREASSGLPAGVTRQARVKDSSSRLGAEEPDGSEPSGLTAPCGVPVGTEPQVACLSGLSQQVMSASRDKQQVDRTTSLRSDKTNNKTNGKSNTNPVLSSRELAEFLGAVPADKPQQPPHRTLSEPAEASRLETPGTDVSPIGDPPVPRPPALPAFHYTHKYRSWKTNKGEQCISCEFCGCMRDSKSSTKPCRPDSWINKDDYNAWSLSQAAIVLAAMDHHIPDLHKVVLV